jgi:transcriptional regulator with XRE-family HTH domain
MTDEVGLGYEEYMKALGARIKQLRQERGLSLRDMVVKHDYHDSQWRKYERSGASTIGALLRIAKALNTSASILLDGLGEYPASNMAEMQNDPAPTKTDLPGRKTSEGNPGGGTDRRTTPDRRTIPDRRKS